MRLQRTAAFSLATVVAATMLAGVAHADEAGCNSRKLKSLSMVMSRFLKCSASGVMHADPPDPDCVTDADARLTDGFADAQADPECASSEETADVLTAMHTLEEDLRGLLVDTPEGARCASGKIRVAAKRAKRELSCRIRAARKADPPDPDCLSEARLVLSEGYAYREMHGACDTTGDAPTVEGLVADFLTFASGRIDGTYTAASPTDLAAVIDGNAIELSWTAPNEGSGLTHARVLRRLGSAPTGPSDGAATVVFDGAGVAALDDLTELLPTTTATPRVYHYAVYGCDSLGACSSNGSFTTLSPTVRQVLVVGGYVLHWRHAAADVCADSTSLGTAETTSSPDWWKSCDSNCATATARQLNNTGRADATSIGDAFATLGIPVGRVVSSEFCRNMETAQLMDFGPAIEQSQELTYFVYDESNRCSDTFVMLGVDPTPGTNTALIGHAGNVCSPLSDLAWGEAAIYKPDGLGGATYIDRVVKTAWLSLP